MSYKPRLKEKYHSEIVKSLTDKFGYKSRMRVPKLSKIVGYSLPSLISKILKIDILVMIASVCTQLFTEELI